IHKPNLPHTFVLEGKDASGRVMVKYGFELRMWFVHRGGAMERRSNHEHWCDRLGYHRMPLIRDLSNALNWGAPDAAKPYSPWPHNYQRRIGGGFFSEWGYLAKYADAGFSDGGTYMRYYWSGDCERWSSKGTCSIGYYHYVVISARNGYYTYTYDDSNSKFLGFCVTP
ncbi:hypothetical protein, partial [Gilliamella sp. Gris3-2]|uniref:hypothetical protein n=2 Tax=unclassified Gilliamella TaxID=2685620 RepID=UPI001C3FFE1B